MNEAVTAHPDSIRIPSPFGQLRHVKTSSTLLLTLMQSMEDIELQRTQLSSQRNHHHLHDNSTVPITDASSPAVEDLQDVFPDLTQTPHGSDSRIIGTGKKNINPPFALLILQRVDDPFPSFPIPILKDRFFSLSSSLCALSIRASALF